MTPLLGTKNPSAPVGDKSGGDRRAARSLLSCALRRGMGRLWCGMGGMGRPERLSAYHRTSNRAFRVFTQHETRDPRHGYCLARGVSQREFRGFHETRNTRHESRPLCFSRNTSFSIMFPAAISHHFPGFPTISRHFPGTPPRASSAPADCRHPGHRLHGCIALPRNGPGLHVSPSGNEKSGRVTRHKSGLSTSTTANRRNTVKTAGRTACLVFWGHETRNTRHGFFQTRITAFPEAWPLRSFDTPWVRKGRATGNRRPDHRTAPAAQSLLACALWSGCGAAGAAVVVRVERHGAAWSGILPLNQCPRSFRLSRLASRRTPKEPMLRKRNVLYSADTRAVSVAGILPSEYNGRTAAMRGMCIWPACLTTRRGEVRERAARTRREPLGARRRTC